jgi:hypothetical protein
MHRYPFCGDSMTGSIIKTVFFSIWLIISAIVPQSVYSQDNELLSQYLSDGSKGSTVTLPLRLKKVDYNFKTIAFYDKDNVDIIFDIDRFEKKPLIVRSMRNLHEGMRYHVKFVVKGRATNGLVDGDLIEFEAIFLDKLP